MCLIYLYKNYTDLYFVGFHQVLFFLSRNTLKLLKIKNI